MTLALVFLAIPIFLVIAGYLAVRMSPQRTPGSVKHEHWDPRPVDGVIALAALVLFAVGPHRRETIFYAAIVPLALAAAAVARTNVMRTTDFVCDHYVNPEGWHDLHRPEPTWRYEMKHMYVHDPEYVDDIVVKMLHTHPSYDEFKQALLTPSLHEDVLDKRLWGAMLPTVRTLLRDAVVGELFEGGARGGSQPAASATYEELRGLLQPHQRHLLMNRLQYHWAVRNLDTLKGIYRQIRSPVTEGAFVAFIGLLFLLVDYVSGLGVSVETVLRAIAAASLLWVVVICGGTTVLLVNLFRGTGTFTIETPLKNKREDELWPTFTRVGIYAFAASFLLYGIGMPILLTPELLHHLSIGGRFVLLSALSFVLCALLFGYYIQGIHNLMRGAREHALALARVELKRPDATSEERAAALHRFEDVRELNTWPLNGAVMGEIVAGIGFPIVVQLILLSAGLAH
jgi:hypothetical protein